MTSIVKTAALVEQAAVFDVVDDLLCDRDPGLAPFSVTYFTFM